MKKPIIYERDGLRSFTNLNAISDEVWAKMRNDRENAEKLKDNDRSQSFSSSSKGFMNAQKKDGSNE